MTARHCAAKRKCRLAAVRDDPRAGRHPWPASSVRMNSSSVNARQRAASRCAFWRRSTSIKRSCFLWGGAAEAWSALACRAAFAASQAVLAPHTCPAPETVAPTCCWQCQHYGWPTTRHAAPTVCGWGCALQQAAHLNAASSAFFWRSSRAQSDASCARSHLAESRPSRSCAARAPARPLMSPGALAAPAAQATHPPPYATPDLCMPAGPQKSQRWHRSKLRRCSCALRAAPAPWPPAAATYTAPPPPARAPAAPRGRAPPAPPPSCEGEATSGNWGLGVGGGVVTGALEGDALTAKHHEDARPPLTCSLPPWPRPAPAPWPPPHAPRAPRALRLRRACGAPPGVQGVAAGVGRSCRHPNYPPVISAVRAHTTGAPPLPPARNAGAHDAAPAPAAPCAP